MPNWCRNEVSMPGIKAYIGNEQRRQGEFDFNKIIPMPESLNIESGSRTEQAILVYLTKKLSVRPEDVDESAKAIIAKYVANPFAGETWVAMLFNRLSSRKDMPQIGSETYEQQIDALNTLGAQYCDNIAKYGCPTWYEWCNANWGTKWNASSTEIIDDETVGFSTAWGPPVPVLKKLSELHPDCPVTCRWSEEGGTYGELAFENGECIRDFSDFEVCDDDDEEEGE